MNNESEQSPQTVIGDQISGDKTTVGNITNAKGVAIGKGSQVIINENPRQPLILLLIGLVIAIIIVALVPSLISFPSRELPSLELNTPSHTIKEVADDFLRDVVVQDGIVWFATHNGLVKLDEDEKQSERLLESTIVTALAKNNQDPSQLWAGTDSGKLNIVNSLGEIIEVDSPQSGEIMAIAFNSEGTAWVTNDEHGIQQYNSDGVAISEPIPLPENEYVSDMAILSTEEQNTIWAITPAGLYWWRDGWGTILNEEDNIPPDVVLNNVIVDDQGGSWFSHSEGLTYIPLPEPLNRNGIAPVNCNSATSNIPPGIVRDMVLDNDWLWLITDNGIARKEIDENNNLKVCNDWQIYLPETENVQFPEAYWKIDTRDDLCKAWLAASFDSVAYRLVFEGC